MPNTAQPLAGSAVTAVSRGTPQVEFWRDPALPFFEGRRAVASVSCYAPHTHPGWSIGAVDSGTSVFSLAQQSNQLHAGDVVVIAADAVHSCNPSASEHWSYRMFHLEHAWLAGLLDEAGLDSGLLQRSRVWPAAQRHAAMAWIDEISEVMRNSGDALQKESVLVTALCDLLRSWQIQPDETEMPLPPADLQAVRDYLRQHCCDKISLHTLAQIANAGRYQLIRQFRRQYGITPHALQLDMRIHQARTLLRAGTPLSEVAYCTGFADQSHFHRAFKSRVAATPAQYQDAL